MPITYPLQFSVTGTELLYTAFLEDHIFFVHETMEGNLSVFAHVSFRDQNLWDMRMRAAALLECEKRQKNK